MRILAFVSLALAALAIGCTEDLPSVPQPAFVQFDSVAIVTLGGSNWVTFFLSNSGGSTAYRVKAYWHFTGDDSAYESPSQPPNLSHGQTGLVPASLTSNPAWTWPTAPDSIRWSATP